MDKRNVPPPVIVETEDEDEEDDEEEDERGVPQWDALDPYLATNKPQD